MYFRAVPQDVREEYRDQAATALCFSAHRSVFSS